MMNVDISLENSQLADCLTGAYAKLRKIFGDVRLTGRSSSQRLFLITFISLHTNISECLKLFKIGMHGQSQLVLRTILESYADLKNLINIDGYPERLMLTNVNQQLKFYSSVAMLKKEVSEELIDEFDWMLGMATDYSARKVNPLTVQEKFKIANLCHYYATAYRLYSSFSHNDLAGTLFGCHDIDHPVLNIHHHREQDSNMNFALLGIVFEVLENSTRAMVEHISVYDEAMYLSFCDDCHAIEEQVKIISEGITISSAKA